MTTATHDDDSRLIPPSETVRIELARSVREARRLRSLLRLALQNEDDRRFLESLRFGRHATPEAPGREGGR